MLKIFVLSFIFLVPAFGQVSISKSEKNLVREHLFFFLNLQNNELSKLPDQIQTSTGSDAFWGHTSREEQSITLHPSLLNEGKRPELLSTLVHEKTHLAYYQIKPQETDFILEGSALVSEFLFLLKGNKELALKSFLPFMKAVNPQTLNLSEMHETAEGYGLSFLFYLYVFENFGQTSFSHQHIRTANTGLDGIIEAAQTNMNRSLTPKSWKSSEFIVSTFYWSLLNRKNMIATRTNDLFSQMASLLKKSSAGELSAAIEIPSYGMVNLKDSAALCPNGNYQIEGLLDVVPYKVNQEMKKTFIPEQSFTMAMDESLFIINTSKETKNLKVSCL